MDAKILGAVFVSLAVVFTGLNGGMFSVSDVRDTGLEAPSVGGASNLPVVGDYLKRPEPENQVKAEIKVGSGSELEIRDAEVTAFNLTKVTSNNMKIDSDGDVSFRDFTGKIKFKNKTRIKGSAAGMETSGVNITKNIGLKTEYEARKIGIIGTEKTNIKYGKASIRPLEGSDFPINTEGESLSVKSFSGNITLFTDEPRMVLEGKVHKITSGKTSYGTE